MLLDVWRIGIFVLWVWILLYLFVPSFELWCHHHWSSWKTHFSTLDEFLKDKHIEISEAERSPKQSMIEFYRTQAEQLRHMQNQSIALQQNMYTGSVIVNGKHASLPKDLIWQNGVVKEVSTSGNQKQS